jgi:hypothetical protein
MLKAFARGKALGQEIGAESEIPHSTGFSGSGCYRSSEAS